MKSTKTRIAASVLAFTIPFAPPADAKHTEHEQMPTKAIESSALLSKALISSLNNAEAAGESVSEQTRSLFVNAIDSVVSATNKSLRWHQAASLSQPILPSILEELHSDALTSIDAAYAETAFALSSVPNGSALLIKTFEFMLEDLQLLRANLA